MNYTKFRISLNTKFKGLGFQQTPPWIDSTPDASGTHLHLNFMPSVTNINAVSTRNKARRYIVVVKKTFRYSNVFFYNRTLVYAPIPQFGTSEHYNGKRYKLKRKETEFLQADVIAAADPGQLVGR
jgi:hypothetical protein